MTDAAAAVADATTTDAAHADAGADDKGELKKLIAQRDTLKAKLRELEPLAAKAKELEQAQMTEQQKLAARIAELEPVAAKSARMESVVGALLEQELSTIPEEMRDVVPPSLAAEDKLDWLRQAKAKGLFKPAADTATKATDSPIARKPVAAGGNTITKSVLADTPNGPKRSVLMQAIREGKIAVIDG